MQNIFYEKVSVNVDEILKFTADEFVSHKSYQHLWPELTNEKRKERLKELHELCERLIR